MSHEPQHFTISEQDFDLTLLPKVGRVPGTPEFRKHVTKYFRKQYAGQPGEVTVDFADGAISVTWMPASTAADPQQAIIDLLNAGDYARAAPMLETLLQANPNDHMALYNLGMVYSDQGRLDDARGLLKRATDLAPDHAHSWTALGVAALRMNDVDAARPALEKAVALEPHNLYAQRTLGTLQAMTGDANAALDTLRTATRLGPNDPITLLSLAQTLLDQDPAAHADEADGLLRQVMSIAPHGEIADKASRLRSSIANLKFRSNAEGDLRHDAVFYCLGALERFAGMTDQQLNPLVTEMATLGQSGLNVNDPETTYRLKLLPGEFTGLQVVCMMHVGVKRLHPQLDSGMDIDQEYEAALALYRRKKDS
ncbi:hypothetical protein CKO42_22180 [Lamprobacter modestohalophilus]|uniref:Tetratricopeptide repeat protein n=1 Tax=Lamprobacter modestohalophilus TaxID=1064514 RepID=A0A9X0WDB2_9GAMM|nr:tetratricopeptide repeat protein [Lamprobacter modestohalophilus]MBK1621080.1 hypothetical protein [Lamprobacter modestohalophilus]